MLRYKHWIGKMFNILKSHLCWGLKPTNKAMILAELIHFDAVVAQFPALVTLVSQQHRSDALSISQHYFRIQVLLPLNDSLKCGRPCHIEHNEGTHGFAVVHSCHVPKSFLTCNEHTHKQESFIRTRAFSGITVMRHFHCFSAFFPAVYARQLEIRLQSAVPAFQWNNTLPWSYHHVAIKLSMQLLVPSGNKQWYLSIGSIFTLSSIFSKIIAIFKDVCVIH